MHPHPATPTRMVCATPCCRNARHPLPIASLVGNFRRHATLTCIFVSALTAAETGTANAPSASSGSGAIVLSPFEVNAGSDVGYRAGNTLSGSRLDTELKDTAAQIAVFTNEFISDLAANNLEEVLQYAANYQTEIGDDSADMGGTGFTAVGDGYADTVFRVRNMRGSRAVDFFESNIPNDNYNIGRFEIASGPNSILFGFGSAGGVVNTTTKRALTTRDLYSYRGQVGSWSRFRNEIDLNKVLKKDTLALRLMGMTEDADGWRHWDFRKQRRGTGAVTYQPFERTTIRALYEKGSGSRHLAQPYNAIDSFSLWNARGRPVKDGFVLATDRPNGIQQITGARQVFVDNSLTYFNFLNRLQSSFEDLGLAVAQRAGATLTPESIMPYSESYGGPGAKAVSHFDQYRVTIEQRITKDLNVDLTYSRMNNFDEGYSPIGPQTTLTGDPNLTLTNPDTGQSVSNPFAGRLYMENTWQYDRFLNESESYRITAAYQLELGKWGRHRFAGLLQTEEAIVHRHNRVEALIDANGVAISNVTTPEAAANLLVRRHYATDGDFGSFYASNVGIPFSRTIGGRLFTNRWVTRNTGGMNLTRKDVDTGMFVMQNRFWKGRVVTTAGVRSDRLTNRRSDVTRIVAGDPRLAGGERVVGELDFAATEQKREYKPDTETVGGVFHATRWLGAFYNQSTSVGPPLITGTVIPDGSEPSPTDGVGADYGLMLDLFDGKLFVRLTRFESRSDDRWIATAATASSANRINDTLLAANMITSAEYTSHFVAGNGGYVDSEARGEEVSMTANPTKNWSLQFNYSHTKQSATNYLVEVEAIMREEETFWREKIRAAGRTPAQVSTSAQTGSQGSVEDEVATMFRSIETNRLATQLGFGNRKHKSNVFTRYRFSEGRLRGAFVGGGVRYQSPSFNQRNPTTGENYYGEKVLLADLLLGYRTRLTRDFLGRRPNVSVQLNIGNVFDRDQALPGRLNDLYNGPRRVYLQEPRSFRLSFGVEL